jgi:hypothetical protein
MSNSVTKPITASNIMGTPQRIIATQAISKGRFKHPDILKPKHTAETTKQNIFLFVPPHSKKLSNFSIIIAFSPFIHIGVYPYYTHTPICCQAENKKRFQNLNIHQILKPLNYKINIYKIYSKTITTVAVTDMNNSSITHNHFAKAFL